MFNNQHKMECVEHFELATSCVSVRVRVTSIHGVAYYWSGAELNQGGSKCVRITASCGSSVLFQHARRHELYGTASCSCMKEI
ncbi:hypothetical protein CBL_13084 [Carabus blaptoides fortunei]